MALYVVSAKAIHFVYIQKTEHRLTRSRAIKHKVQNKKKRNTVCHLKIHAVVFHDEKSNTFKDAEEKYSSAREMEIYIYQMRRVYGRY